MPQDIGVMACKAGLMVRQAISSYTGRDVETAHAVVNLDDEVDELFRKTAQGGPDQPGGGQPGRGGSFHRLYHHCKVLERIADHAVNIAQWGDILRHRRA